MKTTTTIIEFYGLPGVGKTILKNQLLFELKDDAIDFNMFKSSYRKGKRFIFYIYKIVFLLKNLNVLFFNKYKYKFVYDSYINIKVLKILKRDYKYIIIDQGNIQNYNAYLDESLFNETFSIFKERYIDIKTKNVTYYPIYINVDYLTAKHRLKSRDSLNNYGKLDSMTNDEKLDIIYRIYEYNFNTIYNFLKEEKIKTIKIDGTNNLKENTKIIMEIIKNG